MGVVTLLVLEAVSPAPWLLVAMRSVRRPR